MGSEGVLATLAGMILGTLLGLALGLAVKLLGPRKSLPGWPILLFAFAGGMLPTVLQHWR